VRGEKTVYCARLAPSKTSGANLAAESVDSSLTQLKDRTSVSALVSTVHIRLKMPLAVARVALTSLILMSNQRAISVTSLTASL